MNDYPEDYDLDTSDGRIVENGSTIAIPLLAAFIVLIVGLVAKTLGVMP